MTEATEVPGLDVAGLRRWLARKHPELAGEALRAALIDGGRSNLTYRVDGAKQPLVVRRPRWGTCSRRRTTCAASTGSSPCCGAWSPCRPRWTSWTTPRRPR
ncbi:hypothetical protein GCM10029992_49000 [Glycomyces albus]